MWPNIDTLIHKDVTDYLTADFYLQISDFAKQKKLNKNYIVEFSSIYLPLAAWISHKHLNVPLIIGINGAQGSGKSTLSQLLCLILDQIFNKSVLHISIDDLYYSRKKRLQLAKFEHPLLLTRGVPGTHDVELGLSILNKIKYSLSERMNLPVFDKSIDDLLPKDQWLPIANDINIVLFEGWCVGALPQSINQLTQPINSLEKVQDADGQWRHYVNDQLEGRYATLFSMIDHLVMLKVPDMISVFKWRQLQESKLLKESKFKKNSRFNNRIMSKNDIRKFIMYFERITQQCLIDMPTRASVTLNINTNHRITRVDIKDGS